MKPKPLVALNPFTVPMLTGVVPSQDRYSRSPLFDGLVRSNFWKGRQRLNRLYRWIANVVRPKIDWSILCEASPQNNPEGRFFGSSGVRRSRVVTSHRHDLVDARFRRRFASGAYLRRNLPHGVAAGGPPPPGRSSL